MAYPKPPTVNEDERAIDIYRRSAKLIYEKGFQATSMGDIAETVDLTKGGLYYYIKGKQALLYAIMDFALGRLEQEVILPARRDADPESRLERIVAAHVSLFVDDAHAMAILFTEEEGLDATHQPKISERKRSYVDFLRESIAAVQAARRPAAPVSPDVAAHCLLGMMHELVRRDLEGRLPEPSALVDQATRLALHGLAA